MTKAIILVSALFASGVVAADNIPTNANVCVVSTYVFNDSEVPSFKLRWPTLGHSRSRHFRTWYCCRPETRNYCTIC